MEVDQLLELLARGHETQSVEFKAPGSGRDRAFMAKIIRAMLGLANLRDGGCVIIGVDDHGTPLGLRAEDALTWNMDDVASRVAEYADPSVTFGVDHITVEGKQLVVIEVEEFADIPVLCKRDYEGVLARGGCYVRPRGRIQTAPIPTQEDMRDLLDLATEKRLRRFLATAQRAGGAIVSASEDKRPVPSRPQDDEAYRSQLGDLA